MKSGFVFFIVLLFAFACTLKETEKSQEQNISFEMKQFRVESEGGCGSDTSSCASYEFNYPVFYGADSTVLKRINAIVTKAVSMNNPDAEDVTMMQAGRNYIEEYEDFAKEFEDLAGPWYYRTDVRVEVLTDTLMSLSYQEEYYSGGAHGGQGTYFINLDPKTGEHFTLDDFFKEGYRSSLATLAEQKFREVRNLADTASFSGNGFEFPNDQFELNENYGFKPEGIIFVFNSYEIAPYVLGPTEFIIPYDSLKAWIR